MRILSFALLCMLCLTNTALAIAPINLESIKQAQLYGTSQAKIELQYFLKPWLSYEEKAEQLNETAETAYIYTPFLLIATDAREKKLRGNEVRLEDSEKIITDYLDIMSFSVKLYGEDKSFSQNTTGVIEQNGKTVEAWSNAVPDTAEVSAAQKGKFNAQCYFYFDEKKLDTAKPITLVITSDDKRKHRFYFELDKVK